MHHLRETWFWHIARIQFNQPWWPPSTSVPAAVQEAHHLLLFLIRDTAILVYHYQSNYRSYVTNCSQCDNIA